LCSNRSNLTGKLPEGGARESRLKLRVEIKKLHQNYCQSRGAQKNEQIFVRVFQATRSGGTRPVSQHNPGPLAERAFWRARHVGQGDRGHGHPGQPNLRPLSQLAFH
jgi:hypothetical protein